MKKLFLSLLALALVTPAFAQSKTLLNLDKKGVAIQGHDPVAFFTANKPVKGDAKIQTTHRGALYQFASQENKEAFLKEPTKYEPAFGGYCAFGVSKGKLVEIDVSAFQVVGGRLLLQYSKGVRTDFNKDSAGNLKKADGNWPGLLEKKGK